MGNSRFSDPQSHLFRAINSSLAYDRRLYPQDIAGSRAHAAMLAAQGIISGDDLAAIEDGLARVGAELEAGEFEFHDSDEDIHMAIERRLTELVGEPGAKLHTARSRNDQVATDVALYVREHAQRAGALLGDLMAVLLSLAERHRDWALPGYTHLQRAQPVYLSHHLLAYLWMFERDRERFAACERGCAVMPLGAGALAGVNWDTDRDATAAALGFHRPSPNSIDAVANRDFVLDYLGAAAICAGHLSRLGAEIVLWSSAEFGFCTVADAFASGSSLMPQKKNPDAAELLRAKAPRVAANHARLLGVMHGLPLTYNKDMQEDKEALFDSVDTVELCIEVAGSMLETIDFHRDVMAAAAADEMLAAVDVADLLVRKGVPFREAHGAVGAVVRHALSRGVALSELGIDELREFSDRFDDDYYAIFAGAGWLESKRSEGGTALARVDHQIALARAAIGG